MRVLPLEYLRHILGEAEYLIAEKQGLSKYRPYNRGQVFKPCA
jgi:hypothetical protein